MESGKEQRKVEASIMQEQKKISLEETSEHSQTTTTEELERRLESKILDILSRRAATSTMCPSEAARAIAANNWRPLMETTRQVARRMALDGRICITQKGVVCNPLAELKGPVRLKLANT